MLTALLLAANLVVDARTRSRHVPTERPIDNQQYPRSEGGGKLRNSVHQVFRRTNLQGPGDFLKVMDPAFRLASRFLTTDCLLGFWYIVFFRETEEVKPPRASLSGTRHFVFADRQVHMTPDNVRRTKAALRTLADCVTFDLSSMNVKTDGGRCKHLSEPATEPFRGHKSRIQISPYFYEILTNPEVSASDQTWLQFELAKTLLHELAHAALNAVRGRRRNHYYFFPGCNVSEDGFQLEASLFGGQVNLSRASFANALRTGTTHPKSDKPLIKAYITPWPSTEAVEHYQENGSKIGVRGPVEDHPYGKEVSFSRVVKLFTTDFWEKDISRYGSIGVML